MSSTNNSSFESLDGESHECIAILMIRKSDPRRVDLIGVENVIFRSEEDFNSIGTISQPQSHEKTKIHGRKKKRESFIVSSLLLFHIPFSADMYFLLG